MEFNNSILNKQAPVGRQPATEAKRPRKPRAKWLNNLIVFFLISVALLIGAVIVLTSTSKGTNEFSLIDSNKYQAAFLENGQVYFGKINTINKDYVTIKDVYYLSNSKAASEENTNQEVSLSKLGCELHGPQDQMIISKAHLTFWENLKEDGQVVKAIAEYNKQNPNGQACPVAGASNQTNPQATEPAKQNTTPATTSPEANRLP